MVSNGDNPQATQSVKRPEKLSPKTRFLISLVFSVSLVIILGLVTDFRGVLHGVLLALSVAAFLPLILLLILILLFFSISLLSAFSGDSDAISGMTGSVAAGEGFVVYCKRFLVPYYRFLFTRGSPIIIGLVSGLLFGIFIVWMIFISFVLPGEVCSLRRMVSMQNAIDHYYKLNKNFPPPFQGQWLNKEVIIGESLEWLNCKAYSHEEEGFETIWKDGFGRNIHYQVAGHWPITSYTLLSKGYDGQDGKDDICLTGASRVKHTLDRFSERADSIRQLYRTFKGKPAVNQEWSALKATVCPPISTGNF